MLEEHRLNSFSGLGCDHYQDDLATLGANGGSGGWRRPPLLPHDVRRREADAEADREGEDGDSNPGHPQLQRSHQQRPQHGRVIAISQKCQIFFRLFYN